MAKFIIKGGKKLEGRASITCSKNAYLPILAGCILSDEKVTLHNCPEYVDIINMIKILEGLGGKVLPFLV
jgi:UDP-N-acetylglucosamine 1-carboxyvinyltransferase